MIYKFVSWEASPKTLEDAENTPIGIIHKQVESGNTDVLKDENATRFFKELWHPEAYRHGFVKQGGWCFNFGEFFTTYLVKFKHYGWQEVKAPNKTWIRKLSANPSYILKIVDLDA